MTERAGRRSKLAASLVVALALGAVTRALAGNAVAAVLVAAPYLVLAVSSWRTPIEHWAVALGLLGAATAFGLAAASSDAQGGLAFIWILPLQLMVATLFWYDADKQIEAAPSNTANR